MVELIDLKMKAIAFEDLSLIERLPREVIWKIVEETLESILNLRQTSSIMKSCIEEYLTTKRATIQLIETISIDCSPKDSIVASFHILRNKACQFELCLKLREPTLGLIGNIKRKIYDDYILNIYHLKMNDWRDIEFLLDDLGAHIGRRNPELSLINCDDYMPNVFKLVAKISFSDLYLAVVNLTDEFAKDLLKFIKIHEVDNLSVKVQRVSAREPEKLLVQFASLVQTLSIYQDLVRGIVNNSYLFGVDVNEWAQTILEMLSKRLDKLWISSDWYSEFLSKQSTDILRERIPEIGKKVWFRATCRAYEDQELDYMSNEHSVKGSIIHHLRTSAIVQSSFSNMDDAR